MAVKVRLMRIGAKSRPFYRIVAVDERRKRTGGYLDLIGTYNPLTEPKDIKIDQTKLAEWKKKGAVLSDGFLRIIGEAKQRNPRKSKKEKAAKPEEAPKKAEEEAVITEKEEAVVDAPVEEATAAPATPTEETVEVVADEENTVDEVASENTESSEPEVKA
jgi:small subunit ribosomal protein S16